MSLNKFAILTLIVLHVIRLQPEARKALVDKSQELILKEWRQNRHVYENYNSVTGVGGDVNSSDEFYSCGGLLAFIGLMDKGYY